MFNHFTSVLEYTLLWATVKHSFLSGMSKELGSEILSDSFSEASETTEISSKHENS